MGGGQGEEDDKRGHTDASYSNVGTHPGLRLTAVVHWLVSAVLFHPIVTGVRFAAEKWELLT